MSTNTDHNDTNVFAPTGTAGTLITTNTTNTTPATSPVAERLAAHNRKQSLEHTTVPTTAITDTDKCEVSKSTSSSSAAASSGATETKFESILAAKHHELVACLRDLCALNSQTPDKSSIGISSSNFSWQEVLEASEKIFSDYSAAMEAVTREQETLQRQVLVWQEGAYMLDGAVVSERLNSAEEWSKAKEAFVGYSNGELMRTSEIIDGAIRKLKEGTDC